MLNKLPFLTGGHGIAMAVLMAAALGANAQPSHDCEAPEKPESFETQEQFDEFKAEAEAHMECLQAFYEEQAEISREAAAAANAAREEMEEFAASVNQ